MLSKKDLGLRIKEARKIKAKALGSKYTQTRLGYDIGEKSQSYIGDMESGRIYPNYSILSKIAEACGVPLSFFGEDAKELYVEEFEPLVKKNIDETMKRLMSTEAYVEHIAKELNISKEEAKTYISKSKDNNFEQYIKYATLDEREKLTRLFVAEESDEYSVDRGVIKVPVLGVIAAGKPILAEENIIDHICIDRKTINGSKVFALEVKGDSMNLAGIQERDIVIVKEQPDLENGEVGVILVNGDEATVKKFYRTNDTITLMPQSSNSEHQPQIYDPKNIAIKILGKVIEIRRSL